MMENGATSYDSQLFRALKDTALIFYDVNVTKDCIIGSVIQNYLDGSSVDVLNMLGLQDDCAFSAFVAAWRHYVEPEFYGAYDDFFSRNQLIKSYHAGNTEVLLTFHTLNARKENIWAKLKILLFQGDDSDDILAFCYAKDVTLLMERSSEERQDYPMALAEGDENFDTAARSARSFRALAETALALYNVNLSDNRLIGGIMQEFTDGKRINILEMLGLSEHCLYTDFISAWRPYVKQDYLEAYDAFFHPDHLIEKCMSGNDEASFIYETVDSIGNEIWAKQTMLLSEDKETKKIIAFSYVHDVSNEIRN